MKGSLGYASSRRLTISAGQKVKLLYLRFNIEYKLSMGPQCYSMDRKKRLEFLIGTEDFKDRLNGNVIYKTVYLKRTLYDRFRS
jgi:hypothetical protein